MESVKQTPSKKQEGIIRMNENENLVVETTENTEQTAEQTQAKTYTQEEVNEIVGKRIARREAKIRKEYERKYGDLETTLKVGTGKETVEEINETFRDFYAQKGIEMPKKDEYSPRDTEILAKAEAEEIIRNGEEEEEFERLEALGSKMTKREQETFRILAEHLQNAETGRELAKLGVSTDVAESREFKEFAAKFNPKTPIADIYNIYQQTQPKKQYKTMGSMKNTATDDSGVKDYYSIEEARQFTVDDFKRNPALQAAVEKSMQKWKK